MRQTTILFPASVVPRSGSLCRLSRVPAGPWPFPTLSCAISVEVLGPIPRRVRQVPMPISSPTAAASRHGKHVRHTGKPLQSDFDRERIFGAAAFADVQAPPLARPPDRSHRSPATGRPGRLYHASPQGLPTSGCGIATCLIWATDMAGLAPARWQPCRLLPPAWRYPWDGCLCASPWVSSSGCSFTPSLTRGQLKPRPALQRAAGVGVAVGPARTMPMAGLERPVHR